MQIDGARVLITGGGTGIGLATAQQLVAGGARVAICGRRPEPLAAASGAHGIAAIQGDVVTDADRIVDETVAALGGLDVLVNNAAIGYFAPLLETDDARFAAAA